MGNRVETRPTHRHLEGRPYRSVEDLERVKGIGKKRLEEIRGLVSVE
jgi:DNA uptake protein ComE-like DNA-binding protein